MGTRHTLFYMNKEYPNVSVGGGSGSGGGSYSVTTLYENQTTSEVSTITLDDDYSNYDVLYFDILRNADNGYYHDTQYIETSVLSVNDRIEILLYSGIYSGWTLASSTSLTRLVYSGALYIKKILGIKYGSGGGSGGGSVTELTQADYNALSSAEKLNGTLYLVEAPVSSWTFAHSNQGTTYAYTDLPTDTKLITTVVSLNNVCYAGILYNVNTFQSRVLTETELTEIATALSMTVNYATTQTLSGNGTSTPSLYWAYGSNHDYLYLDASTFHVGTKCGYSGCYSHLYYKNGGHRRIYRSDKIYSEFDLI